ncbi:hypothetical protein VPH35_079180 [Triticum aestivum]
MVKRAGGPLPSPAFQRHKRTESPPPLSSPLGVQRGAARAERERKRDRQREILLASPSFSNLPALIHLRSRPPPPPPPLPSVAPRRTILLAATRALHGSVIYHWPQGRS